MRLTWCMAGYAVCRRGQAAARSLEAWHDLWAEEHRKRTLMKKIVLRINNRALSAAFERYIEAVEEAKAGRAEEERKCGLLRRVVGRISLRAAYQAFATWQANVQELRRQRAVLERAALRIKNACAVRALERWMANVEELKACAAKGHKVLTRWKYKVSSRGANTS